MPEQIESIGQEESLAELHFRLLKNATRLQLALNINKIAIAKNIYLNHFRPELIAMYYIVRSNEKINADKAFVVRFEIWLNANFRKGISPNHYKSSLKLYREFIEKLEDMKLIKKCQGS